MYYFWKIVNVEFQSNVSFPLSMKLIFQAFEH